MTACVLDASATVTWLLDDETTAADDRLLDLVSAKGALAPTIWPAEVSNALAVAVRRERIPAPLLTRLLGLLRSFDVEIVTASAQDYEVTILPLALETNLSVYDASYLALALERGLPLASRDKALRRAATDKGVAVLP